MATSLDRAVPLPMSPALGRGPQRHLQKFGVETATSNVGGKSVTLTPRCWNSNILVRIAGEREGCSCRRTISAGNEPAPWQQGIHQQRHPQP